MQNLRLDALKQQYQNAVSYTNSLREQARAVQELEKRLSNRPISLPIIRLWLKNRTNTALLNKCWYR